MGIKKHNAAKLRTDNVNVYVPVLLNSAGF